MPRGPGKDPNKPKGRTSAYAFFVQDQKTTMKNNGEQISFGPFSKKCSELWKEMSGDEKKRFEGMAEIDKKRFDEQMAHYHPQEEVVKGKRGGARKKKDKDAPKRAMSAFMHFCKCERPKVKEENPHMQMGELAKEMGARWKGLGPKDREPYDKMAGEDKERYEREKKEYARGEFRHRHDDEDDDDEDDSD